MSPEKQLGKLPARIVELYDQVHAFYTVANRLSNPNLTDDQIDDLMPELRQTDNAIARITDKQIAPLLAHLENGSPNLRLARHGFRDNLRSAHDIADSLLQDHTSGIPVRSRGRIESYRPLNRDDIRDVVHRIRYNAIYCLAVLRGIAAHHNTPVTEHSFPIRDVKEVLRMRADKHIGKHEEPANGPLHLYVHADASETTIPGAALFGAIELMVNSKKAVSPATVSEPRILINFTKTADGRRLVEVHDSGIGLTSKDAEKLTAAANQGEEVESGFAKNAQIGVGSGKVLKEVVSTARHYNRNAQNPFKIEPRKDNQDGFFKRKGGATASFHY